MAYPDDLRKKTVTFNTYAPAILGAKFQRVTVLGISDYTDVTTFQPSTRHNEVYGYIPGNTEKRYDRISYLKVRDTNGNIMWFGETWIDPDSVEIHTSNDVIITLQDYPLDKLDFLRRMLANNNITGYTLTAEASNASTK